MYYAKSYTHMSKNKSACMLVTIDNQIYNGNFFCAGDQRIKDVLNGDTKFIAFETMDGEIHLINCNTIARVTPQSTDQQPESTLRVVG